MTICLSNAHHRPIKNRPYIYDLASWSGDEMNNDVGGITDGAYCISASTQENIDIFRKEGKNRPANRRIFCIEDMYENQEHPPNMESDGVMWYGHPVHQHSFYKHYRRGMKVMSKNPTRKMIETMGYDFGRNYKWFNLVEEEKLFRESSVVVITASSKHRVSNNRVVKAIMAGKFVVTPNVEMKSWQKFKDYIWMGDVDEGIKWALDNKLKAKLMIKKGQDFIRPIYSPQVIAKQWVDLIKWTWISWKREQIENSYNKGH